MINTAPAIHNCLSLPQTAGGFCADAGGVGESALRTYSQLDGKAIYRYSAIRFTQSKQRASA